MVTIKEVAQAAGVSVSTVSRVLNNPDAVRPQTRKRVQECLEALRYIPNQKGPALLKARSHTVALLIPDITNTFFTSIARAFQDSAREAGWTVIVGNTDDSVEIENELVRSVIGQRVDGIALAPIGAPSLEAIDLIRHYEVPLVLIDREVPGADDVSTIRGNDYDGVYQLVDHLRAFGHRRIGLITGNEGIWTADCRKDAFEAACKALGIEVDPRHICRVPYTIEGGQQAAENLMLTDPPPTAIICANNFLTLGCIRYLNSIGVEVPADVSVVSYDDLEHLAMIYPFLTVVTQPTQQIGRIAARLLIERLNDKGAREGPPPPSRVEVKAELIVRRSSGPPPA